MEVPPWLVLLLLYLLGFILLLIELFIIPGFGLAGISGLTALSIACYLAFVDFRSPWIGIIGLSGSILLLCLLVAFFPKSKAWHRLRLDAKEERSKGFEADSQELEKLVSKEGKSITMLRPAGTALIDGRRVNVVTEGIYLKKDTKVKVVMVKGNRVVVREKEDS